MTTPEERPTGAHPDLVALTRSELSNLEALSAGDHLAQCETCREDLVEIVVGSSLLRRTARTLAQPVPGAQPRSTAALAVPAPTAPGPQPRRSRAPGRARLALAAAVAVVSSLGVAGLTVALTGDGAAPTESATVDRVVALEAVDRAADGDQPPAGEVQLGRDDEGASITLLLHDLPTADADHFYQAWLLEPATNKMLPLGVVAGSRTTFRVGDGLLNRYAAIDLSLEADDGNPQHAAASVLRGSYSDSTPG